MTRLTLAALALALAVLPASAGTITGQYVESRTCDVWTGPCFANAEMALGGKSAVLAWKIERGVRDNVSLDGLGVVAVVATSDTLGLKQTAPSRAVLIVDARATKSQREALVALAREQGGELTKNVLAVESAAVEVSLPACDGGGCALVKAGQAQIETRCLDAKHDKVCGNESAFYPPLVKNVKARAALVVEHGYSGKAFNETWKEADRRGAYVGTFEIK